MQMTNNHKKILIFSTAYFPFVGGAEVAVKEITDRLKDIEFDLLTARLDNKLAKQEKIGNINVYRLGPGWGGLDKFLLPFLGYWQARKLQREKKYDLAWSIMASQASIAAAFFKKKFSALKLLPTLQEGDEEEHLKRYVFGSERLYGLLIRPWHRLVFKRADAFTAISRHLEKRIKANSPAAEVKIVPNGVNLKKFAIDDLRFSIFDFRKKLGIKKNEKVIITVSRLVKKNGVEDLIKSAPKLPMTNYKLLILGTGAEEEKLKSLVKGLKIEDKVVFLGHIAHAELPPYLWASDVFCRPSLSEGLGNVFLEAMAAGLPVVATPVGGIPDFLADRQTGWFCAVSNPADIAEKISYILDAKNKEEVDRAVENARRLVEEKYSWEKIAGEMKNIFLGLISSDKR